MVKISFKDLSKEFSKEELLEVEAAAARTIIIDEESPEMTPEMLSQFKRLKQKSAQSRQRPYGLQKKHRIFPDPMGRGILLFSQVD